MTTLPNRELLDVPTEENEPVPPTAEFVEEETVIRSQWQLFIRRFMKHKLAVAALVVLILLYAVCFFADHLAPYAGGVGERRDEVEAFTFDFAGRGICRLIDHCGGG